MAIPVRQLQEANWRDLNGMEALLKPVDMRCAGRVSDILSGVSQWGLKEIWLGKNTVEKHDRWEHSKGVLAVAAAWLKALTDQGGATISWFPKSLDEYRPAILLAGLLHDFGHLPFAHLVGDVLENINWVPTMGSQSGLEGFVLRQRLKGGVDNWGALAQELEVSSAMAEEIIRNLITGRIGIPWLQAILNSAVDADKIDYICRDSGFLQQAKWPTISRLSSGRWLETFLSEQRVNHAGLLCLHGRSAVAASDLLRERIFLYDRFYLSPMIRVADRLAFEIVQQFLIRAVMSDAFRGTLSIPQLETYDARCKKGEAPDPIVVKCELVADILPSLAEKYATGDDREFGLLQFMWDRLKVCETIDKTYRDFLGACFGCLDELKKGELTLVRLMQDSIVGEPLVFHREHYATTLDALRPLQHTYCREILIDVVKLPRVLAVPARWRFEPNPTTRQGVDYSILVPEGPASAWGPGSKAKLPLTDNAVAELERNVGRVIVIAPKKASSTRAKYIWDRVRSTVLESGVPLEVVTERSNGDAEV